MKYKQVLCDESLLNRLMKEYLVHIEIEDKDQSHMLVFRSTALAILFLAIDDFRNTLSSVHGSDPSILNDTESALQSLSTNFARQVTTVDEGDQSDEEKETTTKAKYKGPKQELDHNEVEDEPAATTPKRSEPALKISFPGAEYVSTNKFE